MFDDSQVDFLTVYWLSGWFGEGFEIWKGKLNKTISTENTANFSINLVWPIKEEPEESLLTIKKREAGLVFSVDWFPDEEFDLDIFRSDTKNQLILMCTFERETIFLHVK